MVNYHTMLKSCVLKRRKRRHSLLQSLGKALTQVAPIMKKDMRNHHTIRKACQRKRKQILWEPMRRSPHQLSEWTRFQNKMVSWILAA
jgi:hypothetical protein